MELTTTLSLMQTISVILAIIVAVSSIRSSGNKKTEELTEMKVDIKYIKQRIDGMDAIRDAARDAKSVAVAANERLDRHLKYDHQKNIERRNENE